MAQTAWWIVIEESFPGDDSPDRTFDSAYGPYDEATAKAKAEEWSGPSGSWNRFRAVRLEIKE